LKRRLYQLYLDAGAPSLDYLVTLIAEAPDLNELPGSPSRDTIHRCLSKPTLPSSQADVVTVATVLARAARVDVDDVVAEVRRHWTQAHLNPSDPLRTVGKWSAVDLGVQPAIDPLTRDPTDTATSLPEYLRREHDDKLRDRLQKAKSGKNGAGILVVLVGGSSIGKTRALYEAVTECLPDWPLLAPHNSEELSRWLATDAVDRQTVLWLDEAQRFLPALAADLHDLLRRIPELAVVATMWPDYWDRLQPPADNPPNMDPEQTWAVRQLLQHHRPCIRVADRINKNQLPQLDRLARHDPRIRAALRAGQRDGRVVQHLTGGPDLVDRYDNDGFTRGERAVITAAVDARRLGHTTSLQPEFLAEAAAAQLTAEARVTYDPQWIETTLRTLCHDPTRRVRGALTALTAERTAPDVGPPDGYHPADYLHQHLRRSHLVPPTAFWNAAREHARTTEDLTALGQAAWERCRLRLAAELHQRAADRGSTDALLWLGHLHEMAKRDELARDWFRRAADAGSSHGMISLGELYEKDQQLTEAECLYQQAADAGEPHGYVKLAVLREKAGLPDQAEVLADCAADAGESFGWVELAQLRRNYGGIPDLAGAEPAWKRAAEIGDTYAFVQLADLHRRVGNHEQAVTFARTAADAGDIDGLTLWADLCEKAGRRDEAEALHIRAADTGLSHALSSFAGFRERTGQPDEAEKIALQGANEGHPFALIEVAELREAQSPRDAERLYCMAIEAGQGYALNRLLDMDNRSTPLEEIETMAQRGADSGDAWALQEFARRNPNVIRLRNLTTYGLEPDGSASEPW
jgi:TPR repeat protein